MSLKIDRVQLEIAIGNDKARMRLRELENEVKKNTREMRKLKRAGREQSDEFQKLEQQTKELVQEQDKLIEGIGLNALSMKELTQRSRELRAILNNLDPNTDVWKQYSTQLDKVNERMKELRGTSLVSESSAQEILNLHNKMSKLRQEGQENSQEFKKLEQRTKELRSEQRKLLESTDLNALSMDELSKESKDLSAILNKLEPDTAEWKQYSALLQKVNARMNELKKTSLVQESSIQELLNLQDKMSKLRHEGKETSDEFKKLEQRTKELRSEQRKLIESVDLNALSMDELGQQGKELGAVLERLDPNTEEWKQYSARLQKVKARMEELRRTSLVPETTLQKLLELQNRMRELQRTGRKNTDEFKKLEQQTKELRLEQGKLIEKIGLNNLSMDELGQQATELRTILNNLDPNTEEWKQYSAQLRKVDQRMDDLQRRVRGTDSAFSRLADRFNKYESIFTWFTAALIGVFYSISQFVRGISEMSDVMGEVMKTTGMTLNQVRELKQEFKTFETRTASRELLNIAYQAGKLGMKTKEEIAGFVKEADIAVVSLGKALGGNAEETINTLGKIIGAFQLEQTMGWEKAMRHTGAVINELGKRSTASEDAIVNYMARLASVGVSLKIPMENIAGIGATLDSLKVPAEQGSTAVQKFLLTIAKESGKLSKFLGVTKQEYEEMVEKDIMGVMLMLLRTAKAGNKGLFQMVQQLDSMDVTGVRMINTVSQMINNVDTLAGQMKIASNEFKKGTSTLSEFNIMNNTFAARMAKVKKEINSIIYGLGVKLEPVILSTVEGFGAFLKFLQRNAEALAFLGRLLAVSTTALISYTAAVKLVELWTKRATAAKWLQVTVDKVALVKTKALRGGLLLLSAAQALLTGNVKRASLAMRVFNRTTRLNPVGLLVSALTTAIALYAAFREETKKSSEAVTALNTVNEIAASRYEEASGKLDNYRRALLRTEPNSKNRIEMVKRLNEIYPKLLENIDAENAGVKELSKAFKTYAENLKETIKMRVLSEEFGRTYTDEQELIRQRNAGDIGTDEFYHKNNAITKRREALQEQLQYQSDVVQYNKEIADLLKEKRGLEEKLNRPSQALIDELDGAALTYAEYFKLQMQITGKGRDELMEEYNEFVEAAQQGGHEVFDFDTWFDNQAEFLTSSSALKTLFEKEYAEYLRLSVKSRKSADQEKERLIKINEELEAYFSGKDRDSGKEKGKKGGRTVKVMPEIQFSEGDIEWAWNEVSGKKKLGVLAKIELEEEETDIDPDLVEKLFNKLGLRKMKLEEVKELIGEINKKYGEVLPTLLNEKSTLDDIQKAQENIGNTTEDLTGKEREKAKQLLVELELRKKALEETKGIAEEINSEFGGKLPVLRGEYGWQLSDSSTPEEIQKAYDELQKILRDNDTKELDYWTEQWKKTHEGRAAFAKAAYDSKLISFLEYQDRLTQIEKEKSAERARISAAALDGASRLFEAQASYNRAQMNRELEAAGDSEEQKDRIRRKYARKQKQIDIKQALIDQAKGIVKIWSEFGKLPPLAAALTAIEVANTASQIAVIESQQFAKGRYNVKGKDDGHIYKDVPFIGEAKTGIRTRPALISERGSEGIVDHRTLFSRKTDSLGMTAMDHFRAITALRYNTVPVPQYAEGNYSSATDIISRTGVKQNQDFATRNELAEVLQTVKESNEANRQMIHNIRASVNAFEVKDTIDKNLEIESRADA